MNLTLMVRIRKIADDHYTNIPRRDTEQTIEQYEAAVVAYISTYHDKILEILGEEAAEDQIEAWWEEFKPEWKPGQIPFDYYGDAEEFKNFIKEKIRGEGMQNCPKCGTELEEDPEDSSEGYCPKCNYGWRFPR